MNRKIASSSDCINKAGVVHFAREIWSKSLVSLGGTCQGRLKLYRHDFFFSPMSFSTLGWLKKGEVVSRSLSKQKRFCGVMGALTGLVGTTFFLHTALLLSQLVEATLCTKLPYASQISHLCPDEYHRGVFAYRGGKCCVLTFTFCYKP